MSVHLPDDRMPEAEVSLSLAFYLLSSDGSDGSADVAIDGAMVKVGDRKIFPIEDFLECKGWKQTNQAGRNPWQGTYEKCGLVLRVHGRSGVGDVVASVGSVRVRAECKGGPLLPRRGSPEYPKLRAALGQLLTVEFVEPGDCLVAAVPHTDKFARLVRDWEDRPLLSRSGIRVALVGRDGSIYGIWNREL
jgi:hypothetical protein